MIVIWNAKAGTTGVAASVRNELERRPGVTLRETKSYRETVEVVSAAADADLVVAAGGDGTVNAVINGLMQRGDRPPLAILPLGTGNNLCRTLEIPLEPDAALRLIDAPNLRSIDLVEATTAETRSFFANVASGGNSERVLARLTDDIKQAWGPWSYLRTALPMIAELKGYALRIQLDDHPPEQHSMWNVMIANAHMAGGGLPVAPRALIDDGLLDVIVVLDGSPLDTTRLAAEFFLGDYLEDERVIYRTARKVQIESTPELGFLADGESFTGQPYTFTVEPAALQVVVPSR